MIVLWFSYSGFLGSAIIHCEHKVWRFIHVLYCHGQHSRGRCIQEVPGCEGEGVHRIACLEVLTNGVTGGCSQDAGWETDKA